MPKPNKRAAGVMFDPDVLAILASLAGREGRSRSWVVNYIIRHYAHQQAARERDAARKLTATIPY
jgi:predicted transcriptional regulator